MDIAITGVGFVHPHGHRLEELRQAFAREAAPARQLSSFDDEPFFPGDSRRARRLDRLARYASSAALLALRHAGIERLGSVAPRAALVGGTMFGGLEACVDFNAQLNRAGPDVVNPADFPNTAHNMACAQTAIRLGIEGMVFTLSSGLAAGMDAILWGCRLLSSGRAELVIAGGFDRWFETLGVALESVGLRNLHPAEGACFVVLEPAARCLERGGRLLARVLSFGQGSALPRALRQTLRKANGVSPALACIGVQGVPRYDDAITAAYRELSKEGLGEPALFAYKRVVGETFGASGPFAVASALARGGAPGEAVLIDGLAWGGAASALLIQPIH